MERLGKKQAERKGSAGKLTVITVFFQRRARLFLVAGLFTIVLSILALVPGSGYTATVSVTSYHPLIRGHRCPGAPLVDCQYATSSCACLEGFEYQGLMNVTFSPYLYPINHYSESLVSEDFARRVNPSVSEASLKESIIKETLLSELPINVPLYYIVGFSLATLVAKAAGKWRRRNLGRNSSDI